MILPSKTMETALTWNAMEASLHYQSHLDRVSRSFAFCIAKLEGDMRAWVGLSYLLCRILDTVEDAPWSLEGQREAAFSQFEKFMQSGSTKEEVLSWAASFPSVPDGEWELLIDSHRIFSDLHELPNSVREKIRGPVLNMYRGMQYFAKAHPRASGIRLTSLVEVNQYCFFVAGLVGGLLTELAAEKWPFLKANPRLMVDAHHFGLFLQKINLLKDQSGDEKEGRFLVPSRPELLGSIKRDAEGAIRYITALPVAEKGFRLFCAWSLFLGLASLPWLEKSWALGILKKIPRLVTQSLLNSVEKIIDDNRALLELFQKMLPVLPPVAPVPGRFQSVPWLGAVYDGVLTDGQFAELGMLPAQ